ncbi:MAG TPA: family 20 glycosylhydrolase, partial [Bacteroidia bacterium]|nr:family 20 glycosylhydrolase [Bacteroidia bacterium]
MKTILVFIFSFSCVFLHAQYSQQRYPVIPKPQTLLAFSGDFAISSKVTIVPDNKSLKKECEFFRQQTKQLFNLDLRYGKLSGIEPCIFISLDSSGLPAEGYELFVNRDGINLYGSRAGIFYGLQTILQLMQQGREPNSLIVPSCSIIDYPRFSWRGMHLDVSRHFFPKEDVKTYLRWMAMYKLNTFHWHLTDDQGWRIEIKKYPLLTQVGSIRSATLSGHAHDIPEYYDHEEYGGSYTQEEVKEIVRFADSLHITVVPEIEMPGHASAMIAAYPYLGNTDTICHVQRK